MRQADYPRALNRTAINQLFNGQPPWSDTEAEENQITVNYNGLDGCRIAHDARSQFAQNFQKPGKYFNATVDMGPKHRRQSWGNIVSTEMNRRMKNSLDYFECFRSKFACNVLHGIGPAIWQDQDMWCPEAAGVEDVLIPANTKLTMRNLPFFVLYHSWTAPELIALTNGPNCDPGWNKPLVDELIKWIDDSTVQLLNSNWPEVWSPEKQAERMKGDGAQYASDAVPTIDTFDFYYLVADGETPGWRRRIILDSWSSPNQGTISRREGEIWKKGGGQFLYNGHDKVFAAKREEIVSFQFADLSAVGPFKYHSVRSLGFLIYGACLIQNRLRCRFTESVFEAMMIYMRIKTGEDVQRALKAKLSNFAFWDESLSMIPANERFQVDAALVELGLKSNQQAIQDNSASFTQSQNTQDKTERTKFEVMARLQASTTLIGAAMGQAYTYQKYEYREIFRRFMRTNSRDPDVRSFRAAVLRQGVPEVMLDHEAWDIDPERVMGAGNKTLEMTIAEQLMQMRQLYDPESQRTILRDVTTAITDDPARAEALVPEKPLRVSDSVHDAQLAAGVLMQGLPVSIKTGMNHPEYVETLLNSMAQMVVRIGKQQQGNATQAEIEGLQAIAQNITGHISIIAQDKSEKQRVKKYGDELGKLMNVVKAFAQRLAEERQKQAQQNGNGQMDPKDQAKIQATMMMAKTKAQLAKESHAQRTAQRQIQFQQEHQQRQQSHQANIAATDLETAAEIGRSRFKSLE